MSYKDRLLKHLAGYRRDTLNVAEPGVFRYQGRDVQKEHILPKLEQWKGIPSEQRDSVRRYVEASAIRLHRYFHHLNSSQAFALSLFVPFFEDDREGSAALLRALSIDGSLQSWAAEAVPDPVEGTNLDAEWSTSEGRRYVCELKLTESNFGKAENDAAHREKLERVYEPRLRGLVRPSRLEAESFFDSYQILRNIWHAAHDARCHVVFLHPRQRGDLSQILKPVLDDITCDDLRSRVIEAHLEDVLERLIQDDLCPDDLRQYARCIAEKYLLQPHA